MQVKNYNKYINLEVLFISNNFIVFYCFVNIIQFNFGSSFCLKGMWILKRWKKSISLKQLSLSDEKNMQESFMYKLSEKKVLI